MQQIEIAGVFKGFYLRNFFFVCPPVHPLGLWWKLAGGVRILRAPESISDGQRRRRRATGPALELGAIRHLPAPSLPASERSCARRFPKDRCAPPGLRTKEIPLPASEMARFCNELKPMIL